MNMCNKNKSNSISIKKHTHTIKNSIIFDFYSDFFECRNEIKLTESHWFFIDKIKVLTVIHFSEFYASDQHLSHSIAIINIENDLMTFFFQYEISNFCHENRITAFWTVQKFIKISTNIQYQSSFNMKKSFLNSS